jgi:hypothetical protein
MIEALACGTPVIAWNCGSVPEVITHEVNGFVVDSIDQAVQAVEQVQSLSRYACRCTFEDRFNSERMAQDYVEVYRRLRFGETNAIGKYAYPIHAEAPVTPTIGTPARFRATGAPLLLGTLAGV